MISKSPYIFVERMNSRKELSDSQKVKYANFTDEQQQELAGLDEDNEYMEGKSLLKLLLGREEIAQMVAKYLTKSMELRDFLIENHRQST